MSTKHFADDGIWLLISKVVTDNASDTEKFQLSTICKEDRRVADIVDGLQSFWEKVPEDFNCDLSFERLEMKLREIPD